MVVIIDFKDIKTKSDLFVVIKNQLVINEFYGNNLDALWDVLYNYENKVTFNLLNKDFVNDEVKEYIDTFIDVLDRLKDINSQVTYNIVNS